ncbi:hypothetical protein BS50DRAFT_583246 [Corynespora cassiicola Philippines]|uniref:Uncharacterized protein n=1 Tax=Corynespora cassiicola Philippines TaxID=1448308 RepID=A0A2T2P7V7_CORCC|nr:hypothetical protein BS50DRAFT_583246 [Corynespora cassiicola Philippines]
MSPASRDGQDGGVLAQLQVNSVVSMAGADCAFGVRRDTDTCGHGCVQEGGMGAGRGEREREREKPGAETEAERARERRKKKTKKHSCEDQGQRRRGSGRGSGGGGRGHGSVWACGALLGASGGGGACRAFGGFGRRTQDAGRMQAERSPYTASTQDAGLAARRKTQTQTQTLDAAGRRTRAAGAVSHWLAWAGAAGAAGLPTPSPSARTPRAALGPLHGSRAAPGPPRTAHDGAPCPSNSLVPSVYHPPYLLSPTAYRLPPTFTASTASTSQLLPPPTDPPPSPPPPPPPTAPSPSAALPARHSVTRHSTATRPLLPPIHSRSVPPIPSHPAPLRLRCF